MSWPDIKVLLKNKASSKSNRIQCRHKDKNRISEEIQVAYFAFTSFAFRVQLYECLEMNNTLYISKADVGGGGGYLSFLHHTSRTVHHKLTNKCANLIY
jgi:hypothetical protein